MDIAKAIKAINPSAEFKYSNEDFSTLEWLGGTTPISQADIEVKQVELRADWVAISIMPIPPLLLLMMRFFGCMWQHHYHSMFYSAK